MPYGDPDNDPNMGGLVAFFAAQTTETTQERLRSPVQQPDGTTSPSIPYGVFTYTIFQSLAKNPNQTYRQLAQASVLADYTAENCAEADAAVRGRLDAPVFGNSDAAADRTMADHGWSRRQATTHASRPASFTALSAGSKLLLLPSPRSRRTTRRSASSMMQVVEGQHAVALDYSVPASDDKHPLIDATAASSCPAGAMCALAEVHYPFEADGGASLIPKPTPIRRKLAAVQSTRSTRSCGEAEASR